MSWRDMLRILIESYLNVTLVMLLLLGKGYFRGCLRMPTTTLLKWLRRRSFGASSRSLVPLRPLALVGDSLFELVSVVFKDLR